MTEVIDSNPDAFKNLKITLDNISKCELKVGWFENSKYPETGTQVAYIAAIQELGTATIPARPFIRPTFERKKESWIESLTTLLSSNLDDIENTLQTFGEIIKGDLSEAIANVYSPPLSEITIGARKYRKEGKKVTGSTIGEIARLLAEGKLDLSGISTKPLIDTGLLLASIDAQVTTK